MIPEVQDSAFIPTEHSYSIWYEMLNRMESYSFFQTPHWAEILCSYNPDLVPWHRWFAFSDGFECVLPMIAVRKIGWISKLDSMPWSTYGGLIGLKKPHYEHFLSAAKYCLSLKKPVLDVTLNPAEVVDIQKADGQNRIIQHETQILKLDRPFEEIWETCFHKNNRRDIRQTQNKNVTVCWSNKKDALESMKRLYQLSCEKWEGVSTIPLLFFDKLIGLPENEVRFWLADFENKAIAGAVVFYGKNEVQYFAAARDPRVSKLNASKFLLSEIIKDACQREYSLFNFGASSGLKGVERFKEIFGAQKWRYYRLRFIIPVVRFIPGVGFR